MELPLTANRILFKTTATSLPSIEPKKGTTVTGGCTTAFSQSSILLLTSNAISIHLTEVRDVALSRRTSTRNMLLARDC